MRTDHGTAAHPGDTFAVCSGALAAYFAAVDGPGDDAGAPCAMLAKAMEQGTYSALQRVLGERDDRGADVLASLGGPSAAEVVRNADRALGPRSGPSLRYGRDPDGVYRHSPAHGGDGPMPGHVRRGDLVGADPGSSTPPGDGSSVSWTAAILRRKEGFIPHAKYDVNHYRLGYGSDTITRADGSVHEVQRGDTVTREDAERDLQRRMREFQTRLRREVGAQNWDRLDAATQGALTSVGYNYGSFAKLHSLRAAIQTGDRHAIADAVRALQGHNGGINRQRRIEEASIIETGHLPQGWHSRDPASATTARASDLRHEDPTLAPRNLASGLLPRQDRSAAGLLPTLSSGVDFDHSGLDAAIAKVDTLHAKLKGLKATASVEIHHKHTHQGEGGSSSSSGLRSKLNGTFGSDGRAFG